jgi:N-acetylglucosaminyldiphosphoundecaprenol N-acetyl-beta-D-mannosaminyltransferase
METINLLNVNVSKIRLYELLESCLKAVQEKARKIVVYANIHALNLACELDWFRDFYNRPDTLVFCDGAGVQLGARLLGKTIPERYTPPDWFPDLCQICAENKISLFFLGTHPGITEKVANIYIGQYPNLIISGTHHGYFKKDKDGDENKEVLRQINQANPNILVIGFGMPLQEKWLSENLQDLNANVYITVGAMFDFLAGETYRGPRWMTDHGFEWLARLFTEPRRLWRRYLIGIPLFFWRVIKQKFSKDKQENV